jgi:hypothetical protein
MTRAEPRSRWDLGYTEYGPVFIAVRCVIRHSSSSIIHDPSSGHGHRPPPPPPTSVRQDTSICLRESYARVVAVDGRVDGGGGGAVAPPSPLGTATVAASLRSAPRIIVGLPLQQTQAGAKCQCQPNAQTRSTRFEGRRACQGAHCAATAALPEVELFVHHCRQPCPHLRFIAAVR